jgi:hypothetical protein
MKTDELLSELYKKYDLTPKDVFKHQYYTIITRSGIEKIQYVENIDITYNIEKCEKDFVVVKALGVKGEKKIETFGSASKDTSQSKYYPEMAEKRAMSRAVLKMVGLYRHGVFGEDESDDFKRDIVTSKTKSISTDATAISKPITSIKSVNKVKNLVKRLILDHPELPTIAEVFTTITNMEELKSVWEIYPNLHTDKNFVELINTLKQELNAVS